MRETNHLRNLYIYGVLFPNGIGEGLPTIRPETALYGYGSKRCLGRTEADRKITSEPWSSEQSLTEQLRPLFSCGEHEHVGERDRVKRSHFFAGRRDTEALYETDGAVREALFGNVSAARQRAGDALELSKSRDVQYGAGCALALSGDSLRSQALADNLSQRFAQDTRVRFTYVPTLRALIALNHGEPSKAIESLQTAIPYELGIPTEGGSEFLLGAGNLYPAYVRGLAYLAARQGRKATAEFHKILDHRGIVISDPVGALAQVQLGRAYVLAGDQDNARTAYRDFLTLWKAADLEVPILKQAKAEHAKLQ